MYSYNRYLAIAARVVRRSLKEGPRLQAERRGEMDLRFAKWTVSVTEALDKTQRLIHGRTASRERARTWEKPTLMPWHKQQSRIKLAVRIAKHDGEQTRFRKHCNYCIYQSQKRANQNLILVRRKRTTSFVEFELRSATYSSKPLARSS